jgi:hypothetical protein
MSLMIAACVVLLNATPMLIWEYGTGRMPALLAYSRLAEPCKPSTCGDPTDVKIERHQDTLLHRGNGGIPGEDEETHPRTLEEHQPDPSAIDRRQKFSTSFRNLFSERRYRRLRQRSGSDRDNGRNRITD